MAQPSVLCSFRDGWFWKGARTPSSPWVPQHQCDSPSSLWGCGKGPLFLGREEQRGQQQDSSGWPALLWKENQAEGKTGRLLLLQAFLLPLTTLPATGAPTGCTSDLWSPNPRCALRSRKKGNGASPIAPSASTWSDVKTLHPPSPRLGPEEKRRVKQGSPPTPTAISFQPSDLGKIFPRPPPQAVRTGLLNSPAGSSFPKEAKMSAGEPEWTQGEGRRGEAQRGVERAQR